MSFRSRPTRRSVLAGLGGALACRPAVAAPERPRDVGIGGTGFAPEDNAGSDRGIGGTGFVGTIQRFGSIVVNDSRIAYAPDVAVTIDGVARDVRDLRVGHVVRVVARRGAVGLATGAITVESEVVGPVTALYRDGIDVLGQRVVLPAGEMAQRWRKGQRVAVSGLRRIDGMIAASLVEARPAGMDRVTGVVERTDDGLWIDGLKLLGLDEGALGRRVTVTGRIVAGGFAVSRLADAPIAPASGPVSLESYLGARDGTLVLGSGLTVRHDTFASWLDPSKEVRVVLDGRFGRNGTLQVEDIRLARNGGQGDGSGYGAVTPGGPQGHGLSQGRPGENLGGFEHGGAGRGSLGGPAGAVGGGPGGPGGAAGSGGHGGGPPR